MPESVDTTSPETTETADVRRRTDLAVERTQLAGWRTGLTALAVAFGVGLVPELSDSGTTWPYVAAVRGDHPAVFSLRRLIARRTKAR